jgi:hypothetical protein
MAETDMRLAILLVLMGGAAGAVETIRTLPQACDGVLPVLTAALDKKEFTSELPISVGQPAMVLYRGSAWGWLALGMVRRFSLDRSRGPWDAYQPMLLSLQLAPAADGCRVRMEVSQQALRYGEWLAVESNGLWEKQVLDDTVKRLGKAAARR